MGSDFAGWTTLVSLDLPQGLGSSELGGPDWVPAENTAAAKVEQVPALTGFPDPGEMQKRQTSAGQGHLQNEGLGEISPNPPPKCMTSMTVTVKVNGKK